MNLPIPNMQIDIFRIYYEQKVHKEGAQNDPNGQLLETIQEPNTPKVVFYLFNHCLRVPTILKSISIRIKLSVYSENI